MTSGIYKITNLVNSKFYIGSSSNVGHRLSVHKWQLKKGAHPNDYLQKSWNKYGENAFLFSVIASCSSDKETLEALEQRFIEELGAHKSRFGYNLRPVASNNSGVKFSDEARKRMSIAKTGLKWSELRALAGAKSQVGVPKKRGWKQPAERALKYRKPVVQLTVDREYVAEYSWCGEAAEKMCCSVSNISGACLNGHKAKGYYWIQKTLYEQSIKLITNT